MTTLSSRILNVSSWLSVIFLVAFVVGGYVLFSDLQKRQHTLEEKNRELDGQASVLAKQLNELAAAKKGVRTVTSLYSSKNGVTVVFSDHSRLYLFTNTGPLAAVIFVDEEKQHQVIDLDPGMSAYVGGKIIRVKLQDSIKDDKAKTTIEYRVADDMATNK